MADERPAPSEVSPGARATMSHWLNPIERFLHIESASGILLIAAAAVALACANSPVSRAYAHVFEIPVGVTLGGRSWTAPLHFWVNDILMTVFFLNVGLEIRREIHSGELSNRKRATLPLAAALGGMVVPALVYASLNWTDRAARRGWGTPMATDIAFAVGILALLGRRIPPALRVLLLAVAIIDDIGSILVIAWFYSSTIHWEGLLLAGLGVVATVALQRLGARKATAYIVPGIVVWFGILRAGIHPTIAGVVMGLLTPAHAWFGPEGLIDTMRDAIDRVSHRLADGEPGTIETHHLARELARVEEARREAFSPAERLQRSLHPWVAFGIMPLFAFANAGVTFVGRPSLAPSMVSLGIVAGLVLGKPIGILTAAFAVLRTGIATAPASVRWRELVVLGTVAGIGFTMAIFIASLAYADANRLEEAKLAILAASAIAACAGLALGRLALPDPQTPSSASSRGVEGRRQ